jgi:hypothetical protein
MFGAASVCRPPAAVAMRNRAEAWLRGDEDHPRNSSGVRRVPSGEVTTASANGRPNATYEKIKRRYAVT